MLGINSNITVIEELLAEGTKQSITYAALECRLTIEQICYDRLRSVHDYISHDDIKKWQPRGVVKTLIQEVDPYITVDQTLSISKEPVGPSSEDGIVDIEYVEVGTQVGFNANYLGKLWNALANLSLHIPVPKSKSDDISRYGNSEKTRKKIEECLIEFKRISKTTLMMSGFGPEVSFDCFGCDSVNKRRVKTLKDGQVVNCINPKCDESYKVERGEEDIWFERRKVVFNCSCENQLALCLNHVGRSKLNETIRVVCPDCNQANLVSWRLYTAVEPSSS